MYDASAVAVTDSTACGAGRPGSGGQRPDSTCCSCWRPWGASLGRWRSVGAPGYKRTRTTCLHTRGAVFPRRVSFLVLQGHPHLGFAVPGPDDLILTDDFCNNASASTVAFGGPGVKTATHRSGGHRATHNRRLSALGRCRGHNRASRTRDALTQVAHSNEAPGGHGAGPWDLSASKPRVLTCGAAAG